MSYPKWLYHKEKEAVIVNSEAEHKALGAEYKESPAELDEAAEEVAEKPKRKKKVE